MYQLRQITIDDSTVTFDSTGSFSEREWIINSFRLALPIGLEAKLHPVFKVRLGGMWL